MLKRSRIAATNMRALHVLALVATLALTLVGCGPDDKPSAGGGSGSDSGTYKPSKLHVALVPSDDTEQMVGQFQKLGDFLSKELGIPVEVQKLTSYAAVIEAMKNKKIDIAWFGPASYVIAQEESKAEPIAVPVDPTGNSGYYSEFIVPANSTIKDIDGIKGKKLALVEPSSTSGGLVPMYMILTKTNTPADKFCTVSFSGSHDTVVNLVSKGSVDAGAASNITIDRMIAQKKVSESSFKVIAKSELLPGSPLCYRSDLDPKLKEAIWAALEKSPTVLGTYSIAGLGDIAKFKQAKPEDFQTIRDMRSKLNVSRETLLK